MGSSPILIGAGNKLIGDCLLWDQEVVSSSLISFMLRESTLELVILFPVMATLNEGLRTRVV